MHCLPKEEIVWFVGSDGRAWHQESERNVMAEKEQKKYGPSGHSWCDGLESTRSIEGRKISAIALQLTCTPPVRQSPRKVCREVVVCSGVCRSCWCTQRVFTASEGVFGEKAGEGEECRRGSGTLEHWGWLLLWERRPLHDSCPGGGGGEEGWWRCSRAARLRSEAV